MERCFTYTAGSTASFIFHLPRYPVNTKESLKEAVRYDSKFSGSLNLQVSRNLPQLYVLFSLPTCAVSLGVFDSEILWTVACQAPLSSVHGILQARILERSAMHSSRGSF